MHDLPPDTSHGSTPLDRLRRELSAAEAKVRVRDAELIAANEARRAADAANLAETELLVMRDVWTTSKSQRSTFQPVL